MKKVTCGIIFILICHLTVYPLQQEADKKGKRISISKFLPGLFQIKEKKVLKGGILFGSFMAGLAGAIIHNSRGNSYHKAYLLSEDVAEIIDLRKKSERRFKSRNIFIIGTGLVFLLHLFDLKISGKKSGVKGEIKNNNLHIGIYYRF